MKQIVFNDNASMLYLSPYVQMYGKENKKILFVRKDLGRRVCFQCDNTDIAVALLRKMETGISKDRLIIFFESIGIENAMELIEIYIRNGVLE